MSIETDMTEGSHRGQRIHHMMFVFSAGENVRRVHVI